MVQSHRYQFLREAFHSSGDIFIKPGMPGLEDGGIVFPSADEKLCRVYLTDIKDGMNGDLDCIH